MGWGTASIEAEGDFSLYKGARQDRLPPPEAFPLGGRWPGAAGTDEGATGYPTEQKKVDVQAAGGWAMAFYKERLRRNRPLISHLR